MTMRLSDAMKRIAEQGDATVSANDEELQEFCEEVDRIGGDIMKPISDEERIAAVSFIQSGIFMDLLQDGHFKDARSLMSNMEVFDAIVSVALRLSVGLAAMEEWR